MGVVTLGQGVDFTNGITIEAVGIELGHNATLSALTYSNSYISSGSPQTVNISQEPIPTIELDYNKVLEGQTVTMAGTPTDDNAAEPSYSHATITDGEGQATITVTAEDGKTTKEYVVNFKVANDKLQSITVPTITLSKRVSIVDDALAILNAAPNNSFAVFTVGGQTDVKLPVTWTFSGTFKETAEASNNFTWTITEAALAEKNLDQNSVLLTNTAAVTNAKASDDATLKSLVYKIGDTEETIDVSDDNNNTSKTIEVTLPATTPKTAEITIVPTANDERAVVAPTEAFKKTLDANKADIVFTVTPENNQNVRTITVRFIRTPSTVAKEKILSITAPTAPVLEKTMTAEEVLAKVNAIEKVAITTESGTPMELPVSWKLKDETTFNETHGAKNEYTWIIDADQYVDYDLADDVKTSGDITVVNFIEALTGNDLKDVAINDENPYTKIGGSTEETTKAESVTVSTKLDNLSFDNVEVSNDVTVSAAVATIDFNDTKVTGRLSLNEDVKQLVLNNTSVGEVALAEDKITTLILKAGSTIGKISNEGELILTNSEIFLTSVVTEVVNNGIFTDKTATIFTVTGTANVAITQLPQSQTTTGKKVELSVTATAVDGATISYQWQKQNGSSWDNVAENSTDATLSITKVSNGTTFYRCEITSTKEDAKTILYTPAVSVTFKSAEDPSTPSDPIPSVKTYTVTLKKVTGATFSQKETITVDEGDNFSFSIKLDKDYDQSKPVVKVGTTTYTADAKGVYTIKNITKDITITVTGIVKNTSTGIEETTEDATRVWSEGSTLYIHTPQAADVYVVSGAGALMRELKAVPGDQNMQLPAGFYIVRVGTYTAKVIIR